MPVNRDEFFCPFE